MSNPMSQSSSEAQHIELNEPKPAVPEFAFDCDPGDESDTRSAAAEAHARSGTRTGRAAPLPSGF